MTNVVNDHFTGRDLVEDQIRKRLCNELADAVHSGRLPHLRNVRKLAYQVLHPNNDTSRGRRILARDVPKYPIVFARARRV